MHYTRAKVILIFHVQDNAFRYCCDENLDKYLKTAGTCELKGTRYIDYSQALTTMETS